MFLAAPSLPLLPQTGRESVVRSGSFARRPGGCVRRAQGHRENFLPTLSRLGPPTLTTHGPSSTREEEHSATRPDPITNRDLSNEQARKVGCWQQLKLTDSDPVPTAVQGPSQAPCRLGSRDPYLPSQSNLPESHRQQGPGPGADPKSPLTDSKSLAVFLPSLF